MLAFSAVEAVGSLVLVLIVLAGVGGPLLLAWREGRGGDSTRQESYDEWFHRAGRWIFVALAGLAVLMAVALQLG